ncbi:hypothetical protein Barb7_01937 [Bacteroidales bacterium Barb7]|nr:hypothetical protein Barb7_01937 [Bacteroidales bacterium Barb7]
MSSCITVNTLSSGRNILSNFFCPSSTFLAATVSPANLPDSILSTKSCVPVVMIEKKRRSLLSVAKTVPFSYRADSVKEGFSKPVGRKYRTAVIIPITMENAFSLMLFIKYSCNYNLCYTVLSGESLNPAISRCPSRGKSESGDFKVSPVGKV